MDVRAVSVLVKGRLKEVRAIAKAQLEGVRGIATSAKSELKEVPASCLPAETKELASEGQCSEPAEEVRQLLPAGKQPEKVLASSESSDSAEVQPEKVRGISVSVKTQLKRVHEILSGSTKAHPDDVLAIYSLADTQRWEVHTMSDSAKAQLKKTRDTDSVKSQLWQIMDGTRKILGEKRR